MEQTKTSVPSKKILHWANLCFSAHAIAQPCRHAAIVKFFKQYRIRYLEYWKYAKMTFHCAVSHLGGNT